MMQFMGSKKGFALSIVMWIVAALLLGVALVLGLSKDTLQLTQGVQDKLTARIEAQNTLEIIKYYVKTADFDNMKLINDVHIDKYTFPKEMVLDGREYNLSKNITLSMRDASSMTNLFYPNAHFIATLASGGDEALYNTIKDSLQDWIDGDEQERLSGAEGTYYKKEKNVLYAPRNYATPQSVEELRLIKGLDTLNSVQFEKLSRYVTPSQNGATVNLALIDADYFSKLLHIDVATAREVLKYKMNEYSKFVSYVRKSHYYDESMEFGLSFNVLITIEVHMEDAKTQLTTFIDMKKNQVRNITTDMYKIY